MFRKIMVIMITMILGFALIYLTWYQLVANEPIGLLRMIILGLYYLLIIIGLGSFTFIYFFGYETKPSHWRLFESQGKSYQKVRKNLGILSMFGGIALFYFFFSLGIDLIIGQPIFQTLRFTFFRNTDLILQDVPIFWDHQHSYLYIFYYTGLMASSLLVLLLYKEPKGDFDNY